MIKMIECYYFSGTGNTLIVLEKMKNVFDENNAVAKFIPMENGLASGMKKDTILGLAFPINSQSTLPFVWNFIRKLPAAEGIPVFVLCTLNESSGIFKPIYRLLCKKGYLPVASCEISMPNNTTTNDFDEQEYQKRMKEGTAKAEKFALDLLNGTSEWESKYKGSSFVSFLSRNTPLSWISMRMLLSLRTDHEKCSKCQSCVKLCPVNNILMAEYPKHLKHCEFCMRCISHCPNKAVSVKGKGNFKARNVKSVYENQF